MKSLSLFALTLFCLTAHADERGDNENLEITALETESLISLKAADFTFAEDSTLITEAEELDIPIVQVSELSAAPTLEPLKISPPTELEIAEAAPEMPYTLIEENETEAAAPALSIDFKQVFAGAPVIYSLLLIMSMGTMFIWLYTVLSLRPSGVMPRDFVKNLRTQLNQQQYEEAFHLCQQHNTLLSKMMSSALANRSQGLKIMTEAMKSEGKRVSVTFWQRIALLNDVAIIAPMLGLLGTVLGMFYAFYDLNRSIESISGLFDGLGISVGTTVAGLVVSIVAMIFHSMTKYRLVRLLNTVDNEAHALAILIEEKK